MGILIFWVIIMSVESDLFEVFMDPEAKPVAQLVHPYRDAPYPMSHIDTFARYPKGYRWVGPASDRSWIHPSYADLEGMMGWIDLADLKNSVIQYVPAVARMGDDEFRAYADVALDRMAAVRYRDEWKSVAELGAIKTIIAEQPAARVANDSHTTKILPYIRERLGQGHDFVLMDLGIGEGGSSVRTIEALTPEERERVTLIAADIMPDAVRISKERFKGLGVGNVVPIGAMAQYMHESPELMLYQGEVDGFVSGACIHQNTRFDDVFGTVHNLMAPGGKLYFWDWLHMAWVHPVVIAGYNIPETTEGLPGRGVEGVREMFKVWPGLHGWGPTPEEQEGGVSEYQARLLREFDASVRTTGFNYHRWLQNNLAGHEPPNGRGPYRSAEAHCDPFIYKHYLEMFFGEGRVNVEQIEGTPLLFGFSVEKSA